MKVKNLISLAIVFRFFFWLFSGEDEVTVYTFIETDSDGANESKWLLANPTTYKIRGEAIVAKTGSSVSYYENCMIFSIDDWKCTYSDGSGSFGIRDGEYWEHQSEKYFEKVHVSWFRYVIEGCKKDFNYGGLQVLACPLRFVLQ